MTTEHKLNIFQVLAKSAKGDFDYIHTLSPELSKSLHPFVIMRWRTGTANGLDCVIMNELVNKYVFSLYNHKPLHWKLLCAIQLPSTKYSWIKGPGATNSSKPRSCELLKQRYNYSTTRSEEALKVVSLEFMLQVADELGAEDSEIAALYKEWGEKVPKGLSKRKVAKATKVEEVVTTDDFFDFE